MTQVGSVTEQTKRRIRLLQLLKAAERAALTPISIEKLHALAYLADILSRVWGLAPVDSRLLKTERPPYFPELQWEMKSLVAMGLIDISDLEYARSSRGHVTFTARYSLKFSSSALSTLLAALQRDQESIRTQNYLDELANALATLRDEDIAGAVSEEMAYSDPDISTQDYVDIADAADLESPTRQAVAAFDYVFPDTNITPSRRLYMYAHYLGRKAHA